MKEVFNCLQMNKRKHCFSFVSAIIVCLFCFLFFAFLLVVKAWTTIMTSNNNYRKKIQINKEMKQIHKQLGVYN